MKVIGLDNGTTGSLSVYDTELNVMALHNLPTKKELSFQKQAKNITRIDFPKLCELLTQIKKGENNIHCFMERPFTGGSKMVNTSLISFRCFEAEIIALEECEIGYTVISSKEWQKKLLPKGISGSKELKKAAYDVAKRLYPYLAEKLNLSNADSVLIAHNFRGI
jgi:hypothetical protein